ncbi:MAG: hypothetical protein WCP16_15070 [Pseudanabaena sp. ELA645]
MVKISEKLIRGSRDQMSGGRTWQNLLTDGKIPKTDADIEIVFAECDRLTAEIRQKIEDIRDTYEELDEMVNKLYGV